MMLQTAVMNTPMNITCQSVALAILSFWRPGHSCFPSTASIAKRAKVCRRTVNRYLKVLETMGVFKRHKRWRAGTKGNYLRTNIYSLGPVLLAAWKCRKGCDSRSRSRSKTVKKPYIHRQQTRKTQSSGISNSYISKHARPGESWEQAKTRLLRQQIRQ